MNETHATVPARAASRRQLHEWLSREPGSLIAAAECMHLGRILPDLFGYHLLQVGRLGQRDLLTGSRILNRLVVELDGRPAANAYPAILGRAVALPVESDSVDVVLLPHILEFEDEPHEALREASRVLVPEGHLVICGFNPWSLLGVWRLALKGTGAMPWCGHFLGANRIVDWLALLGFDVLGIDACFLRPPFRAPRLLERLDFIERAANARLPVLGGAYVALARKRVTTLTPIRTRWKPRRRLMAVGLAEPSVRSMPEQLPRD